RGFRLDPGDVVRAEPATVPFELTRAACMELDRDDLTGELRGLAAGGGAQVERTVSRLRAHREARQLRAAALRPDQTRSESLLVDALDVQRVGQVGLGTSIPRSPLA